jgi:hypothetical protein
VTFANGDASTHRADANANTNFFSRRRRSQRRNGRDNQSESPALVKAREKSESITDVPKSS